MLIRKIKTKSFKISKNDMNIGTCNGNVIIYKKRVKRINSDDNKIDNSLNDYFPYKYENVSGLFKGNKKYFHNIYMIKTYDFPFLIEINWMQSFILLFMNNEVPLQKSDFWYKFLTVILSISLIIITYMSYINQYDDNNKEKSYIENHN